MKQSKLVKKRELQGIWFVLPFAIGFFALIFYPMIQSLYYSFNNLKFDGSVSLTFSGLANYKRAFFVDTDFRELLLSSLSTMATNVPIIIIFSMLIAVFLNGEFPGQATFQIIFFIPVIVSAGIMPSLLGGDILKNQIIGASSMTGDAAVTFDATSFGNLLLKMNLNAKFVEYIQYAVTNILNVMNSSGIQILVFLIALKAIPKSLYEASEIEGATGWETFWKITFPMVLPQMLVNVVYTIIDAFSNNTTPIMTAITRYNFQTFQFGYAAALAWVYFLIVIVILGVFVGALKLLIKQYE